MTTLEGGDMNYERLKKTIVSLSLICAFMLTTMAATVVQANAQGYYYYPYQTQQPYNRVYWGYGRVYSDPWVGYRYRSVYPYRHIYGYPGYYPYRHHYRHHWYHHRPFRRIGDFFD